MLKLTQLSGFGAGAGETTPSIIALQDSSTSSSGSQITAPASIDAGDLLVLVEYSGGPGSLSTPADVTPSGFTQIATDNSVFYRCSLSYRIADGTEDSQVYTGLNGANANYKVMLQFRPNYPITAVNVQDINLQVTGSDPTAQVINASGGTTPLVVIAGYGASSVISSGTSFTGDTEDGTINESSSHLFVKHLSYNEADTPSDITVDMTDVNVNALSGFYIEVS